MKLKSKRIFAFLLTVIMLFSLVSFAAGAASLPDDIQPNYRLKKIIRDSHSSTHEISEINYSYNSKGYITVFPSGFPEYMENNGSTIYEYDEKGNLIKKRGIGEFEYTILYTYDENGKLIKSIDTDDENNYVEKTYYEDGNIKKEVHKIDDEDDAYTIKYSYTYYKNGNVKKETRRSSNYYAVCYYDQEGYKTKEVIKYRSGSKEGHTYKYNKDGNLTKHNQKTVSSNGSITFKKWGYAYNEDGNITKDVYKNDDKIEHLYKYYYNQNGKKIKETKQNRWGDVDTWKYKYDQNGRKTETVYTDPYGKVTTSVHEYDQNDREIKKTCTNQYGEVTTYEYVYDRNSGSVYEEIETSPNGDVCSTIYVYQRVYLHEKRVSSDVFARLEKTSYKCNGKEKTPKILFNSTMGEKINLVEGKDYTVKYSNNKDVGTAKAKVTFIGTCKNYTPVTFSFKIK